ncbi:hypothetical protein A6A19_06655 [Actinobacillus delphinicola]|uniref:Lipoprotein n=1 Tax=Actinobacillus delphinicola TaxID=51161 RepID=A0A448TU67_9PAST|nr:hypothetical protein [Actinobacillus delphinicola]MDG6897662.1 hypothetical protein [Actinobacillus delphinicola]VEJ09542.1 Uncharacterised protein [Actinobacillus delphinicola]
MKFNKSFLTVGILAATMTLAACHDEKAQNTPSTSTQTQPTTTATATPEKAAVTPLVKFNQTVQIQPISYTLSKKDGKEMLAYNYTIVNKSTESLKTVKWYGIVTLGKNLIDIFSVPVNFEKPLPAHSQVSIAFNKPLASYTPAVQKEFLNSKKLQLNLTTVAGEIAFSNAQVQPILVTTDKAVQDELKAIFAQAKKTK